jgi:hypothetical protein
VDEGQAERETLAAPCRGKAETARRAAERHRRIHKWDEDPNGNAPTDPAMKKCAEALTDTLMAFRRER